jgi:hypothetical protein
MTYRIEISNRKSEKTDEFSKRIDYRLFFLLSATAFIRCIYVDKKPSLITPAINPHKK